MAQIHDTLDSEGVLREEQAAMLKGPLNSPGRLCLTPRRLVFLKSNRALSAFGALGAAAAQGRPKNVAMDIALSDITGVAKDKVGLARNVLAVTQANGETAKFAVKGYDEWERALLSAGATAPSA